MNSELDRDAQQLLRDLAPRVLGVLVRRYRDFADCEDAVQEAMLAASLQWPGEGEPENPLAWLIRVATRRLTDQIRANAARRYREQIVVSFISPEDQIALAADAAMTSERDETLELYFMCCHPSLTTSSQIALTLRAVGGLSTAEIARAFLVPEATMAQRLTRAKATIQESGVAFAQSSAQDRSARLTAVLRVLYLIFNEGYTSSSGSSVYRFDLSSEAIRVTRQLQSVLPDAPEVSGLLALMLLTDARREARLGSSGELIPLDLQDRSGWNAAAIDEGTQLLQRALSQGAAGPYQVQAAIAALHDEASSTETTDWPQILALYGLLLKMDSSPMVRLSHTIALAMVKGPAAALAVLDELATDKSFSSSYRMEATRAHLLERAGAREQAILHFRRAADATTSLAERNFLLLHASKLTEEA
ncbi:MAG: sigma-70 family RNA polymerase sigma factor [Acidobacteria bacterium]|nr:sigma-70 family RNA polymerase sigma factor [Acidobacteriota bacterium]MBI3279047.1 sigma-70 family RNA polymerase sigma factor [Acidobacteriota bacterium]